MSSSRENSIDGKEKTRRILGIDPGLNCTGYGIIDLSGSEPTMITYGIIKPPARLNFFGRLGYIWESLTNIISDYHPHEMAVEEVFYHRNARAALSLGQARGAAIVAGLSAGLKIHQYTALQVKKATVGYGRADKKQVQIMVRSILKLQKLPQPEDASDALAVALTHSFWNKYSLS